MATRLRSVQRAKPGVDDRAARLAGSAASLERARRALGERETKALASRAAALRALDPERTLERGYAVLLDDSGEPFASAAALREAGRFKARLADGTVGAQVLETEEAR
jgi:exodeoxyribonuclease VII large subunit